MRLVVLGMGYLGAAHAACMASIGHEVLGVETDPARLAKLKTGQLPFYEPGLTDLLNKTLDSGHLVITNSYSEAAAWGDIFFIAVGTPQKRSDPSADLSFVDAVIDELVPQLRHDALIVGKSTVPVGTAARLSERAAALSDKVTVEIAWNPEFLREGYAIKDTLQPDRIVLGCVENGSAEQTAREIYEPILNTETPFIVTDTSTAELVKAAANAFLATKISFINAMAEVCLAAGADVLAIAKAIGYDPRIGHRFLRPGIGFGGGCLPKDIRAFMASAGELGAAEALTFLREVDAINMRRRNRMVSTASDSCGGSLLGKRVAVLGAAFKPDSDDVRDSPALNVAGQMQLQGASVAVYDPRAMANARLLFPTLFYADSVDQACKDADIVMVLTEWSEFVNLDPVVVGRLVRARTVIDGRFCLDKRRWTDAGWEYRI
ncbi:nucleotide sugar dehydrogenase [Mycolicibacterium chubuense NBB4]|uniref:UDP-glucose 6-dehydrogenase n=1 Tax=Mycolicibacterium chubuense (strain NBB4) TaxID=710421 RepID=I4BFP9_MYCCN|nr:UDP-glucose/GDP-mannose dehydrogenase family protein [Mycolicibacterium chubuense]AFM16106.1 nucleotide sugar dehydrogenase [Mycolicibacterium chubuense NBB4]